MPLYVMDKVVEQEVKIHAELVHRDRLDINMRTTADGHIACREPGCIWVSVRAMRLSPNNEIAEKN